jgi:hypothetical protein
MLRRNLRAVVVQMIKGSIIVEIEDMSYFPSIYDPMIIVEIEDMSYFPSIYDPMIIVEIEDMSYFRQSMFLGS